MPVNKWKDMAKAVRWRNLQCLLTKAKMLTVLCLIVSVRSVAGPLTRPENTLKSFQNVLESNGSNPIKCQIREEGPSVLASISCIFPWDISLYSVGFHVEAFRDSELSKEFEDYLTSCFWHSSGTILCLGSNAHHVEGIYDVSNFTATIPISLSSAQNYLLSCQLSAVNYHSQACQLLKTDHSKEYHYVVVIIVLSMLLIGFCFLALVLLSLLYARKKRSLKKSSYEQGRTDVSEKKIQTSMYYNMQRVSVDSATGLDRQDLSSIYEKISLHPKTVVEEEPLTYALRCATTNTDPSCSLADSGSFSADTSIERKSYMFMDEDSHAYYSEENNSAVRLRAFAAPTHKKVDYDDYDDYGDYGDYGDLSFGYLSIANINDSD